MCFWICQKAYTADKNYKPENLKPSLSKNVKNKENDEEIQKYVVNDTLKVQLPKHNIKIPKTIEQLAAQTNNTFTCLKRGDFIIATDLNKEEYEYLVDGVLAYCYEALINEYFHTELREPITIYIFKDLPSYHTGLKKFIGIDPISPYGHFGFSQNYIVVNFETGPGTLVHELTHALMAPDFPEAPIWISEGMASLYEQCRVENKTLRGEQNWRLPELKKALSEKKITPLKKLLGLSVKEFRTVNESLHYAESRYFCKFLEEMGKLAIVYHGFRDNFLADPTGEKTIVKSTSMQLTQLEKLWHAWIIKQQVK